MTPREPTELAVNDAALSCRIEVNRRRPFTPRPPNDYGALREAGVRLRSVAAELVRKVSEL